MKKIYEIREMLILASNLHDLKLALSQMLDHIELIKAEVRQANITMAVGTVEKNAAVTGAKIERIG